MPKKSLYNYKTPTLFPLAYLLLDFHFQLNFIPLFDFIQSFFGAVRAVILFQKLIFFL